MAYWKSRFGSRSKSKPVTDWLEMPVRLSCVSDDLIIRASTSTPIDTDEFGAVLYLLWRILGEKCIEILPVERIFAKFHCESHSVLEKLI